MFRVATSKDCETLCELWKQGFNENEDIAKFVFNDFASFDNILVLEKNDMIISMLIYVEVKLEKRKGAYYYGLTTRKGYEKQGNMASLMQYANEICKQKEYEFIVLVPQSESLFNYYSKKGYETYFYIREFTHKIKDNLYANVKLDTITGKSIKELRNKFIENSRIQLNEKSEIATLVDMYKNGGITVESKNGYGIFYKNNDTMFFEEIFATDEYHAEELIQGAKQFCGCSYVKGLVAEGIEMFLGEGKVKPFGMILFLNDKFNSNDPYMNMMLN